MSSRRFLHSRSHSACTFSISIYCKRSSSSQGGGGSSLSPWLTLSRSCCTKSACHSRRLTREKKDSLPGALASSSVARYGGGSHEIIATFSVSAKLNSLTLASV